MRAGEGSSIDRFISGSVVGSAGPNIWEAIWKSRALPKVRAFAWKMMSNVVPVRDRLASRRVSVPVGCPFCGSPESILHLISVCRWVHGIWEVLLGRSGAALGGTTIQEWLASRLSDQPRQGESRASRWSTVITACWAIWKAQCPFVFEGKHPNPAGVAEQVLKQLMEGVQANISHRDQQQGYQRTARREAGQPMIQGEAGQPLQGDPVPLRTSQHPPSMDPNRSIPPQGMVRPHAGMDPRSEAGQPSVHWEAGLTSEAGQPSVHWEAGQPIEAGQLSIHWEAGQPRQGDAINLRASHYPSSTVPNRSISSQDTVRTQAGADLSSSEGLWVHTSPSRIQPTGQQHRRGQWMHWVGPTQGTVKINCDAA